MSLLDLKNKLVSAASGANGKMPMLTGDSWINSTPLTSFDLAGKNLLVHFWTYSSVNCLKTLPKLREWYAKYHDDGLELIGIHTPEFDFEAVPRNVSQAAQDLGVTWPIVLDSDYENWTAFSNQYWPAVYLINPVGKIVFSSFGEGSYSKIELAIQSLINNTNPNVLFTPPDEDKPLTVICETPTPETYCGYGKGKIMNPQGFTFDQVDEYQVPDNLEFVDGTIALKGQFNMQEEYAMTIDTNAVLYLAFRGTEINLVAAPDQGTAHLEITLDSKKIEPELRGRDLDETSTLNVERPRMYNILQAQREVTGILSIRPQAGNYKAYVFSFSGCLY